METNTMYEQHSNNTLAPFTPYCWFARDRRNGREQKHFSPLGTKRYFLMNSPRKILCFDPQHGRLVTWCWQ